ncbi:MAG: type 1 glutamine amidotransferase [Acidobacteriota bacterium]
MRVIVFRHVSFESAGLIAPALEARGLKLEYADLFVNPEPPADWRSAAALVFMGGPMSANDNLPFIRRELAVLEEALGHGTPVLGVCLGAQLLARAAGARVYRNPVKEIGWAPVLWTEAARRDPLFRGLDAPEVLFHWHGETFDLPRGAEWLASSAVCRNQAFRISQASYGLQFHLEVTPAMIAGWCSEHANAGDVAGLPGPIDPNAHSGRLAEIAALVFGRWAGLFTGSEKA